MFLISLRWLLIDFPWYSTWFLGSREEYRKIGFFGSTGDDALRAVFPSIVLRPRCSAPWPVWNSYAATQLCLAGFAGDDTARAVSVRRLRRLLEECTLFSTWTWTSIPRSILAVKIWTLFLQAVPGSCVSYRGFWKNFRCFPREGGHVS